MSGLLGTPPTVHVTVVSRSGFSVARGHGVAREGGCTSQSRGGPNPTFLLGIDAGGSMRTGQAMEHGPGLVFLGADRVCKWFWPLFCLGPAISPRASFSPIQWWSRIFPPPLTRAVKHSGQLQSSSGLNTFGPRQSNQRSGCSQPINCVPIPVMLHFFFLIRDG